MEWKIENKKCCYTIESDRVQVNGATSEVQSIEVTLLLCFAGVTRTWRRGGGEGKV